MGPFTVSVHLLSKAIWMGKIINKLHYYIHSTVHYRHLLCVSVLSQQSAGVYPSARWAMAANASQTNYNFGAGPLQIWNNLNDTTQRFISGPRGSYQSANACKAVLYCPFNLRQYKTERTSGIQFRPATALDHAVTHIHQPHRRSI